MFRFIIITIGVFFFLSLLFGVSTIYRIIRFVLGGNRRQKSKNQQSKKKPVSQDERIITYKKKEFETTHAEDVDFEEIKDNGK